MDISTGKLFILILDKFALCTEIFTYLYMWFSVKMWLFLTLLLPFKRYKRLFCLAFLWLNNKIPQSKISKLRIHLRTNWFHLINPDHFPTETLILKTRSWSLKNKRNNWYHLTDPGTATDWCYWKRWKQSRTQTQINDSDWSIYFHYNIYSEHHATSNMDLNIWAIITWLTQIIIITTK